MMSDAIGLEGGSLYEAALIELMSEIRYGLDKVSDTQASADVSDRHICHLETQLKSALQLLMPYRAEVRELEERGRGVAAYKECQSELRQLVGAVKAAKAKVNLPTSFVDLPSDAVRVVCTHLHPRDLSRFCIAYRVAFLCCDRAFRSELAASTNLETYGMGDVPLEVLSLHEDLSASLSLFAPPLDHIPDHPADYSAQVGFALGGFLLDDNLGSESGVAHSRQRIQVIAEAMCKYPAATAVIETHVGIGAPTDVALSYCIKRGAIIAAILVWKHNIALKRLTVRAWGKRLTKIARRSSHPNGDCARAGYGWGELILRLHQTELPPRPDYYGQGVGCLQELRGTEDGTMLAAKVNDAAALLRAAGRRPPSAVPLPPPRDDQDVDDSSGADDDDDDDDDDDNDDDDDDDSDNDEEDVS